MEENTQLQHVIRSILKMQIQFGVYRYGDRLPTMEDACRIFHVSIRTIRAAYQSLQGEALIAVSPKVGVTVVAQYRAAEIEQFVNSFFLRRYDALIDLSRSMQPLFGKAQWLGFQNASADLLDRMERFAGQAGIQPSNRIIQQLQQIYGSLKNDMLMRLVWQVLMFYQAPLIGLMDTSALPEPNPLLQMIGFCRQQNWTELRAAIETFQEQMASGLRRFYDTRNSLFTSEPPVEFHWSCYKNASQVCYTQAMELLICIVRGSYPAGAFLPPAKKLAEEKGVSVNTIRRALSVLSNIGAAKSVNGVGAKVLPLEQIAENCDFTQPVVMTRLLDFTQSLHILTISCRDVAQITLPSLQPSDIEQLKERLRLLQKSQQYDVSAYAILELFCRFAPYRTIRMVYTELFQQLLWGYPLRSTHAERHVMERRYRPCLDVLLDCLERSDAAGFADKLEAIMIEELDKALEQVGNLRIQSAAIP